MGSDLAVVAIGLGFINAPVLPSTPKLSGAGYSSKSGVQWIVPQLLLVPGSIGCPFWFYGLFTAVTFDLKIERILQALIC